MDYPLTFAGNPVERCAELRPEATRLLEDPATRFLLVHEGSLLVDAGGPLLLQAAAVRPWRTPAVQPIFLGRLPSGGFWLFLLAVDGPAPDLPPGRLATLGDVAATLPGDAAALLAYARAMALWQRRHRHCGACGKPNEPVDGGFVMACPDPACGHRSFPRLDPAVITLVHDGDRCLLGRQPGWPQGQFSTIAGFVEPGESLEDAVRREVAEETAISVGALTYLGSQPWPFPSALMIGFHGLATSTDIQTRDSELEQARWFSRTELASGACTLPPQASIAWHLIAAWFDAEGGFPPLASLGLAAPGLRSRSSQRA
ncbi:MAG: NAD(+) diphosphatase [Chromatiales bacterium]|nr:NAD(+) diphosphatase [Chromatiales bacterium]